MFFLPNLMLLPEAVYDAVEYRPRLLNKLGEANLAKLFRVDRVVISKGTADFSKRSKGKTLTPSGLWGNGVAPACTSGAWNEPCAGKTPMVRYP
jgi:hypothetical protein